MFRVIDLNDTGKTKKLLTECGRTNGLFICRHPERVEEKCIAYGIPFVNAVGYGDLENIIMARGITDKSNIYIDELERCMSYLLKDKLSGYSLTKE